MKLFDIIKNRRSIMPNQYNDTPIDEIELNKILESANWAPTHRKTEPWRFKVFQNKAKLKLGDFLAIKYQNTTQNFSKFRFEKKDYKNC